VGAHLDEDALRVEPLAVFDFAGRLPYHEHVLKGTSACSYRSVTASTSLDLGIEAGAQFPGDNVLLCKARREVGLHVGTYHKFGQATRRKG
jgi:hypothetical protein